MTNLPPFTLVMSMAPSRRAEPATFARALELLAKDNEAWLRRQERAGFELPCCTKCIGLRYAPLSKAFHENGHVIFLCLHDLIEKGGGDCGSIAAAETAIMRCHGKEAWPVVGKGPWGTGSHHAVVQTPNGVHDPTTKMEPA